MTGTSAPDRLTAFVDKMTADGLPNAAVQTFADYFQQVAAGETGLVSDCDIAPLDPDEFAHADRLKAFAADGRRALARTVMIKLNGGLGTSMGLKTAKSLLPVKDGLSFLEIIVRQAEASGVALALMNSFSTHADTAAALARINPERTPLTFLQHKFPKVLKKEMAPAHWPADPQLEWNPPGHGDIYTALVTSGTLRRLLDRGFRYAFISNADNLGAALDECLLGYFSSEKHPFMMEVAQRTPSDQKGGHLARRRSNGRLVLREIAQCPADEVDAFTDIERYRLFNTNSIWVQLEYLQDLLRNDPVLKLPIIVNPKRLDPRDDESPEVLQIETAMGAAVSLFAGATAVCVPRSRFFPVKKCPDLLAVRSDCFRFSDDYRLVLHPQRGGELPAIQLDTRYYGKIDQFDARLEHPPSLLHCTALKISGDVRFSPDVSVHGAVTLRNPRAEQAVVPRGAVLEGTIEL